MVTQLPNLEAVYTTRGELRVVAYNSRRTGTIEAAVQSHRINKVRALLSSDQLAQFRALIDEDRRKLDSLRAEK